MTQKSQAIFFNVTTSNNICLSNCLDTIRYYFLAACTINKNLSFPVLNSNLHVNMSLALASTTATTTNTKSTNSLTDSNDKQLQSIIPKRQLRRPLRVSFSNPLVTEVRNIYYYRESEVNRLFYSQSDIQRFSREAEELKVDDYLQPNVSISVISTFFFLLCLIVIGSVNYIATVTNDVIRSCFSMNNNLGKSSSEDSKDLDNTIFSTDDYDAIDYYPMCCPVAPL